MWLEEGKVSKLVLAAEEDAVERCPWAYFPTIRTPGNGKVALQGLHDKRNDKLRSMVKNGKHWEEWIKKWMLLNPNCGEDYQKWLDGTSRSSENVSLTQGYMLMRFLDRVGYLAAVTSRSAIAGFFLPLLNIAFTNVINKNNINMQASSIAAERTSGASSFISDLVGNDQEEQKSASSFATTSAATFSSIGDFLSSMWPFRSTTSVASATTTTTTTTADEQLLDFEDQLNMKMEMRDVHQRLFGYASMQTALQAFYSLRQTEKLNGDEAKTNGFSSVVTFATQIFEAKTFVSASLSLQDCTHGESATNSFATAVGGGATSDADDAWTEVIWPTYQFFLSRVCEMFSYPQDGNIDCLKTLVSQDVLQKTQKDMKAAFDAFFNEAKRLALVVTELQVIAIPRDEHLWLDTAYISGSFGTHIDENSAADQARLAKEGTSQKRLDTTTSEGLVELDTVLRKVENNYVATAKRLDIFPQPKYSVDSSPPYQWKQLRILPISAFPDGSDPRLVQAAGRKLHFLRLANSAADVETKLELADKTYEEIEKVASKAVQAIRDGLSKVRAGELGPTKVPDLKPQTEPEATEVKP
ncbi:unnamed protein product [Amoebophrya sp. A25]|nr:unnamed protein product [Amoebophrya sp. A25]|eukprot:GSA25T00009561001.1